MSPFRVPLSIAAGLAVLAVLALAIDGRSARSATMLLPNLEALPASGVQLETQPDGQVLLRFNTTTWNSGQGPLQLVAGELDGGRRRVYQRIRDDAGGSTDVLAGTFIWHPDHGHFHFEDYALYTLQPVDAPGASERTGSKMTFCVMDTSRIDTKLPEAPKRAQFTTCDAQLQGMSVGWGDRYPYYLVGQWIDVTGLPDGDYNLRIQVDPRGRLQEVDEDDNVSMVKVRLSGGTVIVLDGAARGKPPR